MILYSVGRRFHDDADIVHRAVFLQEVLELGDSLAIPREHIDNFRPDFHGNGNEHAYDGEDDKSDHNRFVI
jgi:hypothetical protein